MPLRLLLSVAAVGAIGSLLLCQRLVSRRIRQPYGKKTYRTGLQQLGEIARRARGVDPDLVRELVDHLPTATGFDLPDRAKGSLLRAELMFRSGSGCGASAGSISDALNRLVVDLGAPGYLETNPGQVEALLDLVADDVRELLHPVKASEANVLSPIGATFSLLHLLRQKLSDPAARSSDDWTGLLRERRKRSRQTAQKQGAFLRVREVPLEDMALRRRIEAALRDREQADRLVASLTT